MKMDSQAFKDIVSSRPLRAVKKKVDFDYELWRTIIEKLNWPTVLYARIKSKEL